MLICWEESHGEASAMNLPQTHFSSYLNSCAVIVTKNLFSHLLKETNRMRIAALERIVPDPNHCGRFRVWVSLLCFFGPSLVQKSKTSSVFVSFSKTTKIDFTSGYKLFLYFCGKFMHCGENMIFVGESFSSM